MVGLRGVIGHFSAPLTGTIPGRDNVINTYTRSAATVWALELLVITVGT